MRKKLIIGNWKMHGSVAENTVLISQLKAGLSSLKADIQVGVCPSAIHIPQVTELLSGDETIALGAQDVNEHRLGAYTGEISTQMLSEYPVRYVLLGHSERRTLYGETNARIAAKFVTVVAAQMKPVLCIGESLQQREQHETESILLSQLNSVLKVAGKECFSHAVIAYEPVWAIGTGKTATPDQAQAVHQLIRHWLATHLGDVSTKIQMLYGGSVKPANARSLFSQNDIDGGLIGGASLKAADFLAICAAAQ